MRCYKALKVHLVTKWKKKSMFDKKIKHNYLSYVPFRTNLAGSDSLSPLCPLVCLNVQNKGLTDYMISQPPAAHNSSSYI